MVKGAVHGMKLLLLLVMLLIQTLTCNQHAFPWFKLRHE